MSIQPHTTAYVYMLCDMKSTPTLYKIGLATDVWSRGNAIEREMGTQLALVRFYPFHWSAARFIEARWHEFFHRKRVRHGEAGGKTEWFVLSERDVRLFRFVSYRLSKRDFAMIYGRAKTWWDDLDSLDMREIGAQWLNRHDLAINPS